MQKREHQLASASELESGIPEGEVLIGQCTGLADDGRPLVEFFLGQRRGPMVASAACQVGSHFPGRQVALLFLNGCLDKPLIVGLLHSPLHDAIDRTSNPLADIAVDADGNDQVIEGKDQVTLRCGEASITLTRAGKIIFRGKYIMSRSTGVNRILGGSVQIN